MTLTVKYSTKNNIQPLSNTAAINIFSNTVFMADVQNRIFPVTSENNDLYILNLIFSNSGCIDKQQRAVMG